MVFNVKDVAEYIGVHPQTIRNYVRKDKIPHKRMGGKNSRILFSKKAIDEWIYKGEDSSCT
jgi:excisionase family DNA binding protein